MTQYELALANAHFVTDFLAIGGDLAFDNELAAEQIELVDAGVTHVLGVRRECDDTELWSYVPELKYRWDGIDDAGQQIPGSWFEGVLAWALEAIEAGGVVLAHCHMGINRGPSVGYAVLLGMGWDPVEALAAIRAARPIAHIRYAEDALAWHFDRIDASQAERAKTLARGGGVARGEPAQRTPDHPPGQARRGLVTALCRTRVIRSASSRHRNTHRAAGSSLNTRKST